jgi:hypothetical protein
LPVPVAGITLLIGVVLGVAGAVLVTRPAQTPIPIVFGNPSSLTVLWHPAGGTQGPTSVTIPSSDARFLKVIGDLNRLPRLPANLVTACPSDDGSVYELLFVYPNGDRLTADVKANGCRDVSVEGAWARARAWSQSTPLLEDLSGLLAAS